MRQLRRMQRPCNVVLLYCLGGDRQASSNRDWNIACQKVGGI
jgi:hypothetical protein